MPDVAIYTGQAERKTTPSNRVSKFNRGITIIIVFPRSILYLPYTATPFLDGGDLSHQRLSRFRNALPTDLHIEQPHHPSLIIKISSRSLE